MADIRSLTEGHETERVEFKESWQDKTALRGLAALANTRGGTLLVGVDDHGRVVGWNGSHGDMEVLSDKIIASLRVQPVSLRVESVDGQQVLVMGQPRRSAIEMPSAAVPVAYQGRYYRRVGNSSREIPPEDLSQFLLERTGHSRDVLPSRLSLTDAVVVLAYRGMGARRCRRNEPRGQMRVPS